MARNIFFWPAPKKVCPSLITTITIIIICICTETEATVHITTPSLAKQLTEMLILLVLYFTEMEIT